MKSDTPNLSFRCRDKARPFGTALNVWRFLLLLLLLLPAAAHAQTDVDATLSKERWREMGFGVSLRPPLGSRLMSRNIDDAALRIQQGDDYAITVYIKNTQQELTINQVVNSAIEQFGFAQPTASIDHQRVAKPAGRPGWIVYFGINLPAKIKPEAEKDLKALMQIARTQYETANQLRSSGQDIAAFRLYKAIVSYSPDKAIAKKAQEWVASFEVDRQFMQRFLLDEAARRKRNPLDSDAKGWYMGQAFMQLAPNAFVMIQLEVGEKSFEKVKPIFEEVIKSLEVQNPKELDEMRKDLIKKGDTLDKTINHRRLRDAMLPEVSTPIVDDDGKPAGVMPLRLQYLRVLENGKDIGWMKIVNRERRDQIVIIDKKEVIDPKTGRTKVVRDAQIKEQGINGIGVDVYARLHVANRAVDSHSQMFLAEDGQYESWSIRTTVRDQIDGIPDAKDKPTFNPGKAPAKAAPAPRHHIRTWLETGVQNREQITIIREGPTGIDRINYRRPTDGYITQTELYLLAPLLPREKFECGFYAYYPNTGTISFRTMRVVDDGDSSGNFRVYSRPSPDSPEQVTEYDRQANIARRLLGEGREVVPITREELAKVWKIDLPDETAAPKSPEQEQPLPPTGRIPR